MSLYTTLFLTTVPRRQIALLQKLKQFRTGEKSNGGKEEKSQNGANSEQPSHVASSLSLTTPLTDDRGTETVMVVSRHSQADRDEEQLSEPRREGFQIPSSDFTS
ncbi:hypothetical protein PS1_001593 [Malus domestica]